MTNFPVNRRCPLTGQEATQLVGYIQAGIVGRSNKTYRSDFLDILGLEDDDAFPIVQGPSGFVFAGWQPDDVFLARLYEDAIDHSRTITETVAYRADLLQLAASFLALVRDINSRSPLRLLDFGCGYGALLRILQSRDVHAFGYDPSSLRRTLAAPSDTILTNVDEIASAGPFDLFVCTEVLEHVPDPGSILRFFRSNAAPGALAAITVPNCRADYLTRLLADADSGRPVAPVLNPWEHLNYFSDSSLGQLLTKEGFAIIRDFGRTTALLDACGRFGDNPGPNVVLNSLRVSKRAWTGSASTKLFCRVPS